MNIKSNMGADENFRGSLDVHNRKKSSDMVHEAIFFVP